MAKEIALTGVEIVRMEVDIQNQKVTVYYNLVDDDQQPWLVHQMETYWVTLPDIPGPTDQQLPSRYLQNLVDLYNAAKADLEARYLI